MELQQLVNMVISYPCMQSPGVVHGMMDTDDVVADLCNEPITSRRQTHDAVSHSWKRV